MPARQTGAKWRRQGRHRKPQRKPFAGRMHREWRERVRMTAAADPCRRSGRATVKARRMSPPRRRVRGPVQSGAGRGRCRKGKAE
ncbi:hypothetical protein DOX71_21545 [Cronobacter sakazakii]|nr:hypothetical protein [Cronobacter sakazakii]